LTLLRVEDLKIDYATQKGIVHAVDGVTFDLEEGENLGLVGESGCGKTTVAKSMLRILPPNGSITGGHIFYRGSDISAVKEAGIKEIRWKEISMISQSAMNALNPVYRIGDQIVEIFTKRKGLKKNEALSKTIELFELVGLDRRRLQDYPHQFSGGMKQRVVIAMALFLEPKVVILDEPTTALDVIVQAQIINVVKDLKRRLDLSLIFITHDLATEAEVADRILVMYAGKIAEIASNESVFGAQPEDGAGGAGPVEVLAAGAAPGQRLSHHPYTRRLLAATPRLHAKVSELAFIPGTPPDLLEPPRGCPFHLRCSLAFDRCRAEEPPLREIEPGHLAACWRCYDA